MNQHQKSLGSRTQKAVSVGFETIAVSTLEGSAAEVVDADN